MSDESSPLQDFSNCHAGILEHFERFGRMPELLAQGDSEAQWIAADMQRFFREVVLEHHAEEEQCVEDLVPDGFTDGVGGDGADASG